MSDQTKYLAVQAAGNIIGGYNHTPQIVNNGALPGGKGPDLQSWRDLMKPIFDQPFPAGYGSITGERLAAIQKLQYLPRVYGVYGK